MAAILQPRYRSKFAVSQACFSFRTKYDYDNLLYIVAGEVIHKVSGKVGVTL
jgi:CubicO group peptidase (beta-lactamase class C family)